MSLFSVLKNNSRLALRGNWGKAILVMLVGFGAAMLLSVVQGMVINVFVEPVHLDPTLVMRYGVDEFFFQNYLQTSIVELVILVVFSILGMLLMAPLNLGATHWHYQLVHGRAAPVSEIFQFFESGRQYRRSLWLRINLAVRSFLWALLFYLVPGGMMGACTAIVSMGEEAGRSMLTIASMGLLLSFALLLLATLFYSAVINKYLLAPYLLCEDEALSVRDAIRISIRHTKGYRFSLLWFSLSFIGWILLCVITLFGMGLYVIPYMSTAMAMYARYIIEKGRWTTPDPTREFAAAIADQAAEPPEPEPTEPAPAEAPAPAGSELEDFQFPRSRIEVEPAADTPPAEAPEAPPAKDAPEQEAPPEE